MVNELKNLNELEEMNYRRFLLPISIDYNSQEPRSIEPNIIAPYICPFCGSKEIAGRLKIRSIFYFTYIDWAKNNMNGFILYYPLNGE